MIPTKSNSHRLFVNGKELGELLRLVKRLGGLGRKRVPITFSEGTLRMEWPDQTFSATARGTWQSPVYVEVGGMRQIARAATIVSEEVLVSVTNDRLLIANFTARCSLEDRPFPK